MIIFERTKAILFNTEEEWITISSENKAFSEEKRKGNKKDHIIALRHYGFWICLLLIPIIASIVGYWLTGSSIHIEDARDLIRSVFKAKAIPPSGWEAVAVMISSKVLGGGMLGPLISAGIIDVFSSQYGLKKDFNRTFSLVMYSYTPLYVAGLLYFITPLAKFIPFLGLYGLYLLYVGIDPIMNPAPEKKSTCLIFTMVTVILVWMLLNKPTIFF